MDKLCDYCREFKSQVIIPNPNFDKNDTWNVCVTCNKIIKEQMTLSFGISIATNTKSKDLKEFGEKVSLDAQKEIDKLSYESGLETFSTIIQKKRIKNGL